MIDSGDLAQAFSDDEKARALLTLTKQVLDRQTRPGKEPAAPPQGPRTGAKRLCPSASGIRAGRDATAVDRRIGRPNGKNPSAVLEGADGRQRDRSASRARRFPQRSHGSDHDDRQPRDDLGHRERSGEGHFVRCPRDSRSTSSSGLSGRGLQRQGAVRQRRARPRHPAHQGAHRLRQSRYCVETGHVCQCQLRWRRAEPCRGADHGAGPEERHHQVFVETAPWIFERAASTSAFRKAIRRR